MTDIPELSPHAIDVRQVVDMGTNHAGATVIDDVSKIVRRKPKVHRNQHGANLGDSVEGFELRVCVRSDVGDPILLRDAKALQRSRPAVAAIEKLLVGQAQCTVNDGLTTSVPASTGAPGKFKRSQWHFHEIGPDTAPNPFLSPSSWRGRGPSCAIGWPHDRWQLRAGRRWKSCACW